MTRRIGEWCPAGQETCHNLPRTAAWARNLWKVTGAPPWDEAVTATRRRWAGHAGRLAAKEPNRWVSRAVQWRNAWWLRTVRFVHATLSGGRPVRLKRGHSVLGKRRWDAPEQHVIDTVEEHDCSGSRCLGGARDTRSLEKNGPGCSAATPPPLYTSNTHRHQRKQRAA